MRALLLAMLVLSLAASVEAQRSLARLEVHVEPITARVGGAVASGNVTLRYTHGPAATTAPTRINLTAQPETPGFRLHLAPNPVLAEVRLEGGATEVVATLFVEAEKGFGDGSTMEVQLTAQAERNGNLPATMAQATSLVAVEPTDAPWDPLAADVPGQQAWSGLPGEDRLVPLLVLAAGALAVAFVLAPRRRR